MTEEAIYALRRIDNRTETYSGSYYDFAIVTKALQRADKAECSNKAFKALTKKNSDRARENKALKAECERKVEILINALNKINKREMGTAGNIAGAALKEFSNGII